MPVAPFEFKPDMACCFRCGVAVNNEVGGLALISDRLPSDADETNPIGSAVTTTDGKYVLFFCPSHIPAVALRQMTQ